MEFLPFQSVEFPLFFYAKYKHIYSQLNKQSALVSKLERLFFHEFSENESTKFPKYLNYGVISLQSKALTSVESHLAKYV